MHNNTSKGFTLVELLVVIAVIGILAAGITIAVNPVAQEQRAHDARRKSDLEQIQRALEQYYNDNGSYPLGTGSGGTPPYSIPGGSFGSAWGTYMPLVPQDPTNGTTQDTYVYKTINSGQIYYLYASLERTDDPQLCSSGGAKCPNAPGIPACGANAKCNYGVASSNATP